MKTLLRKRPLLFDILAGVGLFLFLRSTVSGQTADSGSSPPSLLRIGVAGLHYQVKDQLVAPLRWDGLGFGLRFSYLAMSTAMEQEIDMLIPVSFLSNRYDHTAYAFEVSLGYSRLYVIYPSALGGNLYLGGEVRWNAHCEFYADWDDSHLYWLNVYDLAAAVQWSKDDDNGNHISIKMQIPLFAFISRPPEHQYIDQAPLQRPAYYFDALHQNMHMTSVHEYVSFGLKADYRLRVGKSTILGATWSFQYTTCKSPQTIGIISNILTFDYHIIL